MSQKKVSPIGGTAMVPKAVLFPLYPLKQTVKAIPRLHTITHTYTYTHIHTHKQTNKQTNKQTQKEKKGEK
jgi:hypothetical protein